MCIFSREDLGCIRHQSRKELTELLEATSIDGFEEGALFNPLRGRNAFLGKVILLKGLE